MKITLRRVTFGSDSPTYGVLLSQGLPLCLTLERPWLDNAAQVSCVPPGVYPCIAHNSPDHPDTWEVTSVPNRFEVLIHTGNTVNDTKGCILVGAAFYQGQVTSSVVTMNVLRGILPREGFTLEIINP